MVPDSGANILCGRYKNAGHLVEDTQLAVVDGVEGLRLVIVNNRLDPRGPGRGTDVGFVGGRVEVEGIDQDE